MKKWPLLILLPVLLMVAAPTLAHDPFIEDEDWGDFMQPFQVEDSSISYALYGYLDENDVDVFRLDFAEADALLRVQVLAPVCGEHYASFYPQFAVITSAEVVKQPLDVKLPFELPAELAVIYSTLPTVTADATAEATAEAIAQARPTFVEPFGGTKFYDGKTTDLTVPAVGSYYVVVFNNDEMTGDYTLATGYKEEFNSSFGQMIANVADIKSGAWLHRKCDLPVGDPAAIIEHAHHD